MHACMSVSIQLARHAGHLTGARMYGCEYSEYAACTYGCEVHASMGVSIQSMYVWV